MANLASASVITPPFRPAVDVLASPWGEPLDTRHRARPGVTQSAPAWLWCVHCETSSGVMNDLAR